MSVYRSQDRQGHHDFRAADRRQYESFRRSVLPPWLADVTFFFFWICVRASALRNRPPCAGPRFFARGSIRPWRESTTHSAAPARNLPEPLASHGARPRKRVPFVSIRRLGIVTQIRPDRAPQTASTYLRATSPLRAVRFWYGRAAISQSSVRGRPR